MRGQYPHNTGVWRSVNAPDGGWEGYRINGNEQDNLVTRLDAAGYRTALIGKYFNGYADTTHVPRDGTTGSLRSAIDTSTTTSTITVQ